LQDAHFLEIGARGESLVAGAGEDERAGIVVIAESQEVLMAFIASGRLSVSTTVRPRFS
jgi:hypothetical protein